MSDKKRFIEESFPVKEVSEQSAREKNIRHGHISTLHIWWARRPLASSRATNYAALIPAAKDPLEWQKKRDFIIEFSKWENSLRPDLIKRARKDVLEANGGVPPKILDPFAGGGSIPLEALRLGCETYAGDLNPVAVLLLKCTLEYPQKYGRPVKRNVKANQLGQEVEEEITVNPLIEDVKKWSQWVLEEARKEIEKFYPQDSDGSIPVGYIWARTIPCQNPSCGAEIPLMRQYWLAKKDDKKVALYPYVEDKQVNFKIVGTGYEKMPKGFDPGKGTVSKAVAVCLACGSVVDADDLRKMFQEKKSGQRLVTVVTNHPSETGKSYRIAGRNDLLTFLKAAKYLELKRERLVRDWGIDPVPDEPIHTPDGTEYHPGGLLYNFTPVVLYGMTKWGDLFNARQKLSIVTFVEKVREAFNHVKCIGPQEGYVEAVVSYLAIIVGRLADKNCNLVLYNVIREEIEHVFGRQALGMVLDNIELNPFTSVGWANMQTWVEKVLEHCSKSSESPATVSQASATALQFEDGYFDAIFTDPPYYDNVPYADLSNFFYVWQKRMLVNVIPSIFSTPSAPSGNEIIAELPLLRGLSKSKATDKLPNIKTKEYFESKLKASFKEIHRVLKPEGVSVIVYAHKSTEGWETLINSLLDSGLVVSAAWPISTERSTRLRANESAALASSIYIVSRKTQRSNVGFYTEVKAELRKYLSTKLDRLWSEGLGGADFFIAAIGAGIEVYGKYEKVMDYEGKVIRADTMLQDVRELATDYAVHQILHNGFAGEISDLTRFYVLFRWNYGEAKVQFDEAKKMAMSCGIDLAQEWSSHGFIEKEKEFIRVLGPQLRKINELQHSSELIDVLHLALLLWEKSKREDMIEVLQESGFGKSEAFYRVAQAISETLPIESKEKKLLDGFLAGRQRITGEVKARVEEPKQSYLFPESKESRK